MSEHESLRRIRYVNPPLADWRTRLVLCWAILRCKDVLYTVVTHPNGDINCHLEGVA